jgi:hypothetical protein
MGRKQTLKYLKGYANESEPVMSAGEPRDPPPRELIASMAFGEPCAASAVGETLPKWVENDRKVRMHAWNHERAGQQGRALRDSTPPCMQVAPGQTLDLLPSTSAPTHPPPRAQVLRFWGYFKEAVTESNIENHRVRRVVLYYYLADDSLQVGRQLVEQGSLACCLVCLHVFRPAACRFGTVP